MRRKFPAKVHPSAWRHSPKRRSVFLP